MQSPLDYKMAGVDIEAGDQLIERIKPYVKRTQRPEWLGGLGGFGALFEIPVDRYNKPVLVSGTDGVGTKLKLALMLNQHDTIGIDLVAMCANDILAQGAEPLFFLDYYACGKLDINVAESVIKGIAKACEISGMSLVGGETAEMPDMYQQGEYDLAGFCVGVVEKDRIITGKTITASDQIIAIASSGPHSNGYSLIRKVVEVCGADLNAAFGERSLGQVLLTPTKIYTRSVLSLLKEVPVKGIAHITGGGITGNLVRILPEGTMAAVDLKSWEMPAIFQWLATSGNINTDEMFQTFNCGIGLMLVVSSEHTHKAINQLNDLGETAWLAGEIKADSQQPRVIMHA